MKSTKTNKSDVKCVRYYIIRRKLLHYQARGVHYIIRQTLLYYQAASLLHYRVMLLHYQAILLHYQAVITLIGDYYIIGCNSVDCCVQFGSIGSITSSRQTTPVSKGNCQGTRIKEASSAAFTCRQRPHHVSYDAGCTDNAEA